MLVNTLPPSRASQPLKIVNPKRPANYHKHWKRIKADCAFLVTEQQKLKKYGPWLRALHDVRIAPKSEFEQHFVSVCRRKAAPVNDLEAIWLRYIHSRLVETQLRRLHFAETDYATARSAIEKFASDGNPFAREWLQIEGEWEELPSDGKSSRVWSEGAVWQKIRIVRG